ncbi:Hypothetical protein BN2458_PEG0324 [Helicobacter typhlonius]|uniref:Uncharacterized protein n=1 Tax=Helicobacter typhlonius TaxID=76936 RepID=A0A0S4PSF2_9HELI|nr:Hypothetical protein BN2458_PEG0324 [Helicobacter typhlonius]
MFFRICKSKFYWHYESIFKDYLIKISIKYILQTYFGFFNRP